MGGGVCDSVRCGMDRYVYAKHASFFLSLLLRLSSIPPSFSLWCRYGGIGKTRTGYRMRTVSGQVSICLSDEEGFMVGEDSQSGSVVGIFLLMDTQNSFTPAF